MSTVEWVLAVAAVIGLGMAAAFVWSVLRVVRRVARGARRAVEPVRVRGLAVRSVVSPSAAARRDLAREVLGARQAYLLARRDGRPVQELGPAVHGLERVARSLEADLRMGAAVDGELARARSAARSLTEACRLAPGRHGLLDSVADTAAEAVERARLVAEAHRELRGNVSSGESRGAPPARP
ncbi:MAG: hypothetical protein JWP14_1660 [Frankiales bacterium]|nr:hypothetical protein [Frankiales bacterium]